ncbi:hypothetical protein CO180_04460 [candidate division WWE3 bacterium CG_4_9_14_3_um_filter_41_6]|uniref:Bacterial Ig-like domain-containing protein n=1 Tax=candidate division WWE3 bacterium CG_4_10_14_0_2_um_filter_41_14 TaxID=1975072 RepID=A0A2M7TEX6_UNCKA|nr:MAG: hypothetical protein COY32_06720 [candidate division WWE3 bacterium CG_4_10_14_0_2_um_filter_41_14]PJA38029.1 MAG: hypothetical protein CO180_04460 [candidate division WWE3 bacterium CG_4_9_14_3_um_filter_41_6]
MPKRQFARNKTKDIRSSYSYRPQDTIRNDEKVVYRNLFVVFALVLSLSAVLYLYGIDIVVGLSDFWRGAFPNSNIVTIDNTEQTVPVAAPRIDPVSLFTKDATVDVKGWAQPGVEVEIYLNDSLVSTVLVDKNGRFEYTGMSLSEGGNTLYSFSIKDEVKSGSSDTYTITRDSIAPILTVHASDVISEPTPHITIAGSVDEKSTITVNEQRAILHADNTFSFDLSLSPGVTQIAIKAIDLAGNEKVETLSATVEQTTAEPTPSE